MATELDPFAFKRDMLRRAFASALVKSCGTTGCEDAKCCAELAALHYALGLIHPLQRDGGRVLLCEDHHELWTGDERPDGFARFHLVSFLSSLVEFQCFCNPNILEGWYEVPEEIGQLLHEDGWGDKLRMIEEIRPLFAGRVQISDPRRRIVIEEFITQVAKKCFTDSYLTEIEGWRTWEW